MNWVNKIRGATTPNAVQVASTHDVTEVAPGLVVTSSKPFVYLDVRKFEDPKVLAVGQHATGQDLVHGNLWPQQGKDKWLLVGGETGSSCAGASADGLEYRCKLA